MQIVYDSTKDVLYLHLDDRHQPVLNKRVAEDVVLDIGKGDRIVGIEILDASRNVNLQKVLPVDFDVSEEAI